MNSFRILIQTVLILFLAGCAGGNNGHTIVKNGKAKAVIVMPAGTGELKQVAVEEFRKTILRSSGAEIPVISEDQMDDLPGGTVRIFLGPSTKTAELGFTGEDLLPEEFLIHTAGNDIVILSNDIYNSGTDRKISNTVEETDSRVTAWAFSCLLDRYLGVRWLWPGELGTLVPQTETIHFPELDIRFQQPLGRRTLNIIDPNPEILEWTSHHQVAGMRIPYKFRHSFREGQDNGNWFARFQKSHPEFLAKNPDGRPALYNNRNDRFKLCISNPDVSLQIIRDWEAAGMPDFWDVTPNDGNGFCCCNNCKALDLEYGDVAYTSEEIWKRPDHVVLTDRYVWFWNQLITKMRQKNPATKIGVYFYGAYRDPPGKLKIEEGIVGTLVHGMDFSYWEAWQDAGAGEIGLRPNWWHMGACGPNLPLRQVGSYIEKARDAGMVLIYMDTMMEYWPTQGPYFYLVARLIARPDLDTETIISEYCDAFGSASRAMRKYFQYWEDYHKAVAYNIPAGGKLSQDTAGIYETVCRQHFGAPQHPLRGHWMTLPYIYTEEIMAEAREILDEASGMADTEKTSRRIDFFRDGLDWVDCAAAFMGSDEEDREHQLAELTGFNRAMKAKYDYWNPQDIFILKWWGIIGEEVDLEGM